MAQDSDDVPILTQILDGAVQNIYATAAAKQQN